MKQSNSYDNMSGEGEGSIDACVSTNTSSSSNPLAVKKGILLKKGMSKFIRPWSLRTIVLCPNQKLRYYDQDILKGEISLVGTMIQRISSERANGKPFAFEISNISGLPISKSPSLILGMSILLNKD